VVGSLLTPSFDERDPHAVSRLAPVIESCGALCSTGRGIDQIHASVRAGLGGFCASSIHDRHFEPMTLALLPEEELEPLADIIEPRGYSSRLRRMLRLAGPAMREAVASVPEHAPPMPLFLGLPEPRPGAQPMAAAELLSAFSQQSGVAVDVEKSRVFPSGRAAALLALEAAARHLADGAASSVLVGGVDTYLDLAVLGALDAEERVLGDRVMDGFVPGEGAAFIWLRAPGTAEPDARVPSVTLLGVGAVNDPGHRYGTEPARGEGLAGAMDQLFAALPGPVRPIESAFAGFNGESFQAKEWGIARLRHTDRFSSLARIDHPADCFGDGGAALGALLLALAHAALIRGNRKGPALVFASSDHEPRACALLDLVA
jgi:3-oxoacyl-[acyl-carrier-protein] synthase-1